MIRSLLPLILLVILWYVLKAVCRSFVRKTVSGNGERERMMGEEMVLDPECRTYVPKARAVSRRIGGEERWFCSEACAQQYADKNRG